MRILLVDDEEIVLKTLSPFLKDSGYEVREAKSAEEAIKHASNSQENFDALITDYNLGGKNGRQLISELKSMDKCPKKVILMSDNQPDELPAGIIFLKKPFSLVTLEENLKEDE